MAALVVPSAALIRLVWTAGGTAFAVNVLGARKLAGTLLTQADANSVGGVVMSAFTSSGYAAQVHSSIALASVGLRDISQASQPEFVATTASVPGTAAGGKLLPPQVALVCTLRTLLAGKSYRGRFFAPGWADAALEPAGTATPAAQTAVAQFMTVLSVNLGGAGVNLAVVSRKLAQVNNVAAVQVRDRNWDTIRGRSVPGI